MTKHGKAPVPHSTRLLRSALLLMFCVACTRDRQAPRPHERAATSTPAAAVQRSDAGPLDGQPRGVAITSGELPVRVTRITSSGLSLSWPPVPHATDYDVFISPEPPDSNGDLSKALRVRRLPAKVHSLRLDGIVPDVHLFAQVRAHRSEGDPVWGAVHVRLPRPRSLVGPGTLVSTYAMGPTILAVVVRQHDLEPGPNTLLGNRGADWQGGSWKLTRSGGAAIPIVRTMRHSVPTGQGNLPLGFDRHAKATVHVEHRIYLELQEPIGTQEILRLQHRGAAGTEFDGLLPFSDRYLETPVIQVNQVGYNPRASLRWAYVYGWLGDGGPLQLETFPRHARVLIEPTHPFAARQSATDPLPLQPRSARLDDVGSAVREINLATLPPAEGVRYRVHLPGVGVSFPTAVSEQASFKSYYTILRGLFHNRWCGDLRPELTEWSRPPDHCEAYFTGGRTQGFFPKNTEKKSKRPLRGGHHDAADFDIRPFHVLVGQALLRAFEIGGEKRFSDGQLRLPESGNGIPDLLDEALWSLSAWQHLQNPNGSVRLGVESTRHPPGYYFAHEDQLPYFAYDSTPAHTAYVAGLFAQAAFLLRPYDAARSEELLDDARRALSYAKTHGAPSAYLAYAWSELTRAGDRTAGSEFERSWQAVNVHGRGLFDHMQPSHKIYPGSFDSQHPAMADFTLAYLQSSSPSAGIVGTARSELRTWADSGIRALLQSPQAHRSARPVGARPDWGQEVSQGRYLDGVYQLLQLGKLTSVDERRAIDALSLAADAMLGCNPASMSFVSGLGSRSPEQPLHLDSLAFQLSRGLPPIPGIVVYGPIESMPAADYYKPLAAAFHPPFDKHPRALRYIDAAHAVNTNEFSVWESQAPAALLFAVLLPDGLRPWAALAPGQPEHKSPLPPHTRP